MKIDFLVNSLVPGGAERVLVLLANHFEEQGQDVTIITFQDNEVWTPNKTIKRVKLHQGRIKNQMIRSTKVLAQYYYKKNNRPDILISFMTTTNLIGVLVARLYGIKIIASEHNNHLKEIDSIGNFTRNYAYRYANALTVLTAFDEKFYKNRKVNVSVMPNPCTFDIYKESQRNRRKIILAVGFLDRYHHKGFDNLIPLIAPVLKRHNDWSLKLVGGGSKGMKLLKGLTKEHNIENQVIFEGFSKEVSRIMKESDIYIMSSRFEGLPMVLLEAMSQGMACISFDCITGPSEIINHNVNGILIEDQNLEAMSAALEKLINNPEKRLELAKQSINSLDRFNIDTIYKKYLNIFESIL
jgi:GalNAc-alpha-(1->4)-GalNAc-alpha-(1->3)-diNAcBac-PP-undecaprenol alpha-1,4-N-acetyl-D-galactosaminyltransferase